MDNTRLERELALVERHLADLREMLLYHPGDPEVVSEELALERLRLKILEQLRMQTVLVPA